MKKNLFKIYLILLAICWMCQLIVPNIPLFEEQNVGTRSFINYILGGSVFVIFEIFFMASFFVEELENKKKSIIIAFFLSWVCMSIILFLFYKLLDIKVLG